MRRVVEPLLSGGDEGAFSARDLEYVRDLGLVASNDPLRIANHPYHRPNRDPVPIGPVYVHRVTGPLGEGGREEWQPSPDTEEIRQHLLDIVRLPEEHADEGYHFYTHPAHIAAITQLLEWRDERLIPALEEIARRPEVERVRADIEETTRLVRKRLGI